MQNRLRDFFYSRDVGPGIWKWDHYFDIYDRHFSKFRGKAVNIVEIGIYSGGSLDLWRDYFGPAARIIGIDIQPECRVYERDGVSIYIGDQSDSLFWHDFKLAEPNIDIVIDDGSHKQRHQKLTFDEMFSHIRYNGVYLCEDIHGYPDNEFSKYMTSIVNQLHIHEGFERRRYDNNRYLVKKTSELQRDVQSISFYPYVCVIEKNDKPVEEFVAPRKGTQWQPFKP